MSNITLNIVEPGSSAPIEPVVPNTGLFTSGIGGTEATIITVVSVALILTIVAIVLAVLYKKHKKQGRTTKLVHTIDTCKSIAKSKKRITAGLSAIALLVSAGTFATLLSTANKNNTSAAEADDGLTLDISGGDITIEVGEEPVFAVAKVKATVAEGTPAGYTLTAYTDSTDLVSTTNPDNTIPMVAVEGDELEALTGNTYGLALVEPELQDEAVFTSLSTDKSNPTIITDKDYEHTEANDTTTIYYGFYITPDVPYGTYTGTNINYNVEPHYITNLSFNGNGNDGGVDMEGMTIIAGDTITIPQNTYIKEGYSFTGWNTDAEGQGEAYADEAEYTAIVGESTDVTLYAQWEALPVIGDLTYMQDFASLSEAGKASVMNSMISGQQYQLKDSRDEKSYYISKLADGNVWMTQNLDLDLNSQTELTPANTNISANWTPVNSTITFTGTSVSGWSNSDTVPCSADPGDVYYYTSNTNDNDIQYNSLVECEAAGHTDCAHYHAGNYYNWSAAVANNNTVEITEPYNNVETSICPAGWRLPKNRNAKSPIEGNEQITMITSYDGILGEYSPYGPPGGYYNYLEGGFNAIRTNPLWLVRSSSVYYGSLGSVGGHGYYWSNTISSIDSAYHLNFYSSSVLPVFMNTRGAGCSVRCLVQ